MDNINKEKLDALFQEGAERYDFTYREDAWASMDGMLDDQDKKRKKRFLGWWILVGAAALVGAFGLKHYLVDNQSLVGATAATATVKEITTTSDITSEVSATTKELTKQELVASGKNDQGLLDEKVEKVTKVSENNNINNSIGVENPATGIEAIEIPKLADNNSKAEPQSASSIGELVTLTQTNFSSSKMVTPFAASKNVSNEQQESISSLDTKVKTSEIRKISLLPSGTLIPLKTSASSLRMINLSDLILLNDGSTPEIEKPKLKNRFAVGLTAGPEFSFVGGTSEAKAGYYLGLELGYQITNRFEVIAGLGVSKKRYLGDGANYKTEPGFWTDEIAPMEFQGKCTVIEIPVAVNYYFKDANENGWFASLGATTYLMSTEWYDFIYDPAINRTDLKASWTDNMANNHLLGVGQISFGYQQKIGNRTSLQISPYAKIPLTGIGNGAVNLFSTGLRLTARFK